MNKLTNIDYCYPENIQQYIKTGTIFDTMFYTSGLPYGKITEIVGNVDGYKTYLALSLISQIQRRNKELFILYIDTDCKIISHYITSNNIDTSKLILIQSNICDEIVNTIQNLTNIGIEFLIIIDSVSNIEWKGNIKDSVNGLMVFLTNNIYCKKISVLLINQVRTINKQKRAFCGNILNKYCTYRFVIKDNIGKTLKIAMTRNKYSNKYSEFIYNLDQCE